MISLGLAICLNVHSVQSQAHFRYLNEPAVIWDGDRMSGELKNVPVSGVLEELLRGRDGDCEIDGRLNGVVTISFRNLTVEQIIRKILSNNNYNYTILFSTNDAPPEKADAAEVRELTIYQDNTAVRFARIERSPLREAATAWAGSVSRAEEPPRSVRTVPLAEGDIQRLDEEIKAFMDEMLAAEKIDRHEYESALKDVFGLN